VWGYSLVDATAAVAIVCALQRLSLFRILENNAVVGLGKISYGLYVFHVPALLMLEAAIRHTVGELPRVLTFIIYIAATVGVSALSFRYFERLFLRMKRSAATSSSSSLGLPRET